MKSFKAITIVVLITFAIYFVNCTPSDRQAQLGNRYRIDYNQRGGKISIVDSNSNVIIRDQVIGYAFDSTFIVAVQKPMDSIPECRYKNNESLDDCKIVFEESTFRQYWIINKTEKANFNEKSVKYSNVYGPFNRYDFLKKLKQLKVPQNLKLKE
ncbi:hypothetical protein ACVW0P_002540 [Mucilaginibacter sp. UYNi724]